MPEITMDEKNGNIIFHQHDKYGRGIFWPQSFQIGAWKGGNLQVDDVNMQDSIVALSKKEKWAEYYNQKVEKLRPEKKISSDEQLNKLMYDTVLRKASGPDEQPGIILFK